MLKPAKLHKGDTIAFVLPSRGLRDKNSQKQFDHTLKYFVKQGFRTKAGKYTSHLDYFTYATVNPRKRAEEINELFADRDVHAIWCFQGGFSANNLFPYLDYDCIRQHPKLFIGLSDGTSLVNVIHKETELVTFHGPDPYVYQIESARPPAMTFKYTQREFEQRLMKGSCSEIPVSDERKTLRRGKASGRSVAVNINALFDLLGSAFQPDFNQKILFLEVYRMDIDEAYAKLYRLKMHGVFDQITGLVLGYIYFYQFKKDAFPVKFEDIVMEIVKDYNFPVLKTNEFGHYCANTFIPLGVQVELDSKAQRVEYSEEYMQNDL